jgi:hypothetical protein
MESILTKTNKTFAKTDQNLSDLEVEYDNLEIQVNGLKDNPDNPEYQQLKNELWLLKGKIKMVLRG